MAERRSLPLYIFPSGAPGATLSVTPAQCVPSPAQTPEAISRLAGNGPAMWIVNPLHRMRSCAPSQPWYSLPIASA